MLIEVDMDIHISLWMSINRVTYTPLIPFSIINNISIYQYNFTLVFLKAACHAIRGG